MKYKKITYLSLLLILAGALLPPVSAQTATASQVPSKAVEDVRERVKAEVEKRLGEIQQTKVKQGWLGTITEINETSFELKKNNETRSVTINEQMTIIDQARREIDFDELSVDQKIIAMGYTQVDGQLEAHRIVLIESLPSRPTVTQFGTIIDKSSEEMVLSVTSNDDELMLILDNETDIYQKKEGKLTEIDYEELKVDSQIIAVSQPREDNHNTYTSSKVVVTP